MKKKLIFAGLIFFIILSIILLKIEYKEYYSGNNISKNADILDISSFEATVTIEINSNKNTNKYVIKQEYNKENIFKQEVLEPNNIKGLTIISDGKTTTIENNLLNLKSLYENIDNNFSNLNLIQFITTYKESDESEIEENEAEIIMKTKLNNSKNRYQMYQNLYISKSTNLPSKMEILDINKNVVVYILYNEIKLN